MKSDHRLDQLSHHSCTLYLSYAYRDSKVILVKREIQDLLDPKAVLYNDFYNVPVMLSNIYSFTSIVDKGEKGIIGLQGQKGDTVSHSDHVCLFSSMHRVQLVSLDQQDRSEKLDKKVTKVLKVTKAVKGIKARKYML